MFWLANWANLAIACCELGYPQLGCHVLEKPFAIPKDAISEASMRMCLHTCAARIGQAGGPPAHVMVPVVAALIRSLRESGRTRHGLAVLQAWLTPRHHWREGMELSPEYGVKVLEENLDEANTNAVHHFLTEAIALYCDFGGECVREAQGLTSQIMHWLQSHGRIAEECGPHVGLRLEIAVAMLEKRWEIQPPDEESTELWQSALGRLEGCLRIDSSSYETMDRAEPRASGRRVDTRRRRRYRLAIRL